MTSHISANRKGCLSVMAGTVTSSFFSVAAAVAEKLVTAVMTSSLEKMVNSVPFAVVVTSSQLPAFAR